MLLSPPVQLVARLQSHPSRWELALRYGAATAATLIAIAGAQLQTPNAFIWILTLITLVGVPVSLWLRLNEMRVGRFVVPRPLLNSATVLSSFGASLYFVFLPMSDFFGPLLSGNTPPAFWMSFGGGEPITALMELFLLFAAFRSFAIISDKDATLTTVPSFSVLLLLIVIHRGIEVVVYFVAWTFVAATLLALDHRSEIREDVSATVPALIAGQDVRLGARSLATILGVSLLATTGISLYLASRDPDEHSATETAVTALATRLTSLALALPEVSSNGGPERQIDFKNGPTLPSRTELWQVQAFTADRQVVQPAYWRMFTLSNYNGVSWTQSESKTIRVPRSKMDIQQWPWRRLPGGNNLGAANGERNANGAAPGGFRFPGIVPNGFGPLGGGLNGSGFSEFWLGSGGRAPLPAITGFDVRSRNLFTARQFANSGVVVRQRIVSLVSNIGFLPVQPAVRAVVIQDDPPKEIRLRDDGALDIGVMRPGQLVRVMSEVPPLAEYGIKSQPVPDQRLNAAQIARSGRALLPQERAIDLRLPATLPARVRDLSAKMLTHTAANASNYAKAERLALALQQDATYTLRPPIIPDGRDATDYFLFEGNKRGYCTYFAGALTVLCRAQGIPARVVSGFAGMTWNGSDASLLREGNAHAWTEVWVDGFGWAVVDATPADDRGDNSPTWVENWADWMASSSNNAAIWLGNHKIGLATLVLVLVALWVLTHWHQHPEQNRRWKADRNEDSERRAVTQIYGRTSRLMARKFRPKTAWETPDEWLQSCAQDLSMADTEALRRLTALYLAARYGTAPLPRGSARLASETATAVGWKRLKSG